MATEELNSIYETREEEMVSQEDGKVHVRMATFLKPCAKHVRRVGVVPPNPILSQNWHWPSKIVFNGWNCPQKKWGEWVDRLAKKYAAVWNKTGIFDAIMSSKYEVWCNKDLVLGLTEFWCDKTNTFLFPWGEATITLQDVMVLGGFPVIGEPITITSSFTNELVKIPEELNKHRMVLLKSRAKKAEHYGWIKHFMEKETEYEHAAFLSLWLSRYVFPSFARDTIESSIFPIAATLSQGVKLELAPAILAHLYRNLKILRDKAIVSSEKIIVSGLFHLVQLWAYERFPLLEPKPLKPGEPRVARWHKLLQKISLPAVRSVVVVVENFDWRPYATDLVNDVEVRSFIRCLQTSELVGIGCQEKYMPHRVAMQFGYDQDLSADKSGFTPIIEHFNFYVPPPSVQPSVSLRYSSWWKDLMIAHGNFSRKSPAVFSKNTAQIVNKSSDDKTPLSSSSVIFARMYNSQNTKSKFPSLVRAERSDAGNPRIAAATLEPLKSAEESSEVSKRMNHGKSNESISPHLTIDEQLYEDSSDDHVPISRRQKRLSNKNIFTRKRKEEAECSVHKSAELTAGKKPIKQSRESIYDGIQEERDERDQLHEDSSDDDVPISQCQKRPSNKNIFTRKRKEGAECSVHVSAELTAGKKPSTQSRESICDVIQQERHERDQNFQKIKELMGIN